MILRDHSGAIIFSSCRFLRYCASPLEAEVAACMEGIALTLEWSKEPFTVHTDCLVAANMIKEKGLNRSPVASLIGEVKKLLSQDREYKLFHVSRNSNNVSHMLAQLGLLVPRTAVWLRGGPDEIDTLCQHDCNDLP
ncbi:hypothetical protein ACQJBY_027080 [Aegilops geniculata]